MVLKTSFPCVSSSRQHLHQIQTAAALAQVQARRTLRRKPDFKLVYARRCGNAYCVFIVVLPRAF
jgi:hypothetical protein